MASEKPYKFNPYEPGVLVEIYLPKKAKYQGKLYGVLTDGFDWEKVKAHFSNSEKKEKILELLDRFGEDKSIFERIDKIEQFYWGYSMYEVDGVFFSEERKKIDEERTQVIRIMFLPDLKSFQEFAPEIDFQTLRRTIRYLLEKDKDTREIVKDTHPELHEKFNQWLGDIGLFVFGYVIFELCLEIKESGHKPEDEIWVTSFWDLHVNKVTFKD